MNNVTPIFRNCSAACAEMLGGQCQGADCPYAPDDSLPLGEAFDHGLDLVKAELRGFRQGTREVHARIEAAVWHTLLAVTVGATVTVLVTWAFTR